MSGDPGLLGKVAKLGGLRLLALALLLVQNVLIVRFLSLENIAGYYLLVTVAYLGNAAIFVGADFYLQRQLARLSDDQPLHRAALARYVGITAAAGGGIVLVASAVYFSATLPSGWLIPMIVCTSLSVATYLSTLGRNLCQLAAHPAYANLGPVIEGVFRAGALCVLAFLGQAQAVSVAVLSMLGALLGAATTLGLLLRAKRSPRLAHGAELGHASYIGCPRQLADAVVSVGASGVLNWAQLQGYRPLLMTSAGAGGAVVGSVSFLSTLGGTAANAVFTILSQLQVPQQYRSQGASTGRYLRLLGVATLGLAVACLPAGALFLWLSAKWQLLGLVYLVAVGVLVEAGNAAIGACTHHMNAQSKTLWGLPLAGGIGCGVTFAMLLMPLSADPHIAIALALVTGQALAVAIVLTLTYRPARA